MAFFGGQPKTTPAVEHQTDGDRQESADIPELPEPRSNTVIAKDLLVTGKLSGEGVVQIEGTIEGEVNLKGYVIVTSTGKVKGPVEADVIRIAGQVEGNLISHDHVQLERTGTINGDVTTVSFVIENGGRLNGRTTMVPEQASTPHVERLEPSKPEDEDI
ncbi:MAG: polymer-forming cytoskeletal protein [Oscillibacter sp.]|nr:polymer-forming cytoskeletal protein [Oscillibacter sp.]